MHIHIFWDSGAPEGIQTPVVKNITSLAGIQPSVEENPVRLAGYAGEKKQVDAAVLLDSISAYRRRHAIPDPVLLVIAQDLFIPRHSFVFGLAREREGVAVVSSARLGNSFYGRDHSDDDLIDRLSKEGAHEIGHLLGLSHCSVPECIMFKPDTLAELDCKKKMFCPSCRQALESVSIDQIRT
ncbi:MAG TPA: archaemetzincin family Zn-dependent metalloprotease [Methanoregulaceae archaeon]|nr:archaemetzincin family Zn-dependent metalloprotease [Methanoregulaceae archaeon]HPD74799.1 archaemetzincin family Zn-dependent metalloprotease [Methanoregulaceae archaeon]HRY75283.1 archaemetzincin family Zn-dependent metalloprotease [Methanoregulaceae archaeon]